MRDDIYGDGKEEEEDHGKDGRTASRNY